ncbi:MAG: GNAT family N-acetyltransferase [candidate division FCPU426 bacterium]
MEIQIEPLSSGEQAPLDLLKLADPSEKMVAFYLSQGECFVAKESNAVVGVIISMKTKPDTFEIMAIAVKTEMQNKGIGKRLIAFVREKVKKTGAKYLEIGTGNPGVQQMLLYQKCGFRIVGVDLDYFRRNHDEKIMVNGIECRDMIRMQMEL